MKTNVSLERVLETCRTRSASDAFLIPGAQVLIRIRGGWRTLQTNRVTVADLASMAARTVGPNPAINEGGYAHCDFNFGNVARFKAMAFGYPETTALLLVQLTDDPPGSGNAKVPVYPQAL